MRLGLIEADRYPARLPLKEIGIRGACASASLKRAEFYQEIADALEYPRRMRLGLIEAGGVSAVLPPAISYPRRMRLGLIEARIN